MLIFEQPCQITTIIKPYFRFVKIRLPKGQNNKINSPEELYPIMQKILLRENKIRRKQEYFWAVGLSQANRIDYIELVALGKVNRVDIQPVELFSFSVQKRCPNIILVHNHPSGETTPSPADILITKQLKKGAKLLGITVLDHLIITETDFYSFKTAKKL